MSLLGKDCTDFPEDLAGPGLLELEAHGRSFADLHFFERMRSRAERRRGRAPPGCIGPRVSGAAGKADVRCTDATVDTLRASIHCLPKGAIIDFRDVGRAGATKEEHNDTLGIQVVATREIKAARRMLEGELKDRRIVELSAKRSVSGVPGRVEAHDRERVRRARRTRNTIPGSAWRGFACWQLC
jgi:hypothetical protein